MGQDRKCPVYPLGYVNFTQVNRSSFPGQSANFYLACEQSLHLGYIVKSRRVRGDAKAGGGGGGPRVFAAHSRVLVRFASLAQIGELACRLTFSQQSPQQYSQISPCRPTAITYTPIIRTAAKSQKKINYRHFTLINFRYYGLSLMGTLPRGP